MTTVDSFSYGKKGRRLSPHEAMVKRIKTWAPKTVAQKARELGIKRTAGYSTFLDDLATAILTKENRREKAPL